MKPYEKIPQEDMEALARICEFYQSKIRGFSLIIPVALPMISLDPSTPIVRVTIDRAHVLINEGTILEPEYKSVISRRHYETE